MNNLRKRLTMLMLAVMLLGSSIMLGSSSITMASTDNILGIDVTAKDDTKTMYYLNIPLKDKFVYMNNGDGDINRAVENFDGFFYGTRVDNFVNRLNTSKVTFIFTYNNIKINNLPLLTTWNISVSALRINGGFVNRIKMTFTEDIAINIRSEYYNLFQGNNFADLSITMLYEGKGYLLSNSDTKVGWWSQDKGIKNTFHNIEGISLEQREVPSDYDPIEQEGQAPDNGGIVTDPVKKQQDFDFLERIKQAWINIFNGSANLLDWVIFGISALALLVVFGFVGNILSFVFKK